MENKILHPKVLLALPVYNEEQYLSDVLDRIVPHVDDVLVVDDGSTDMSKAILADRNDICVVSHPDNRGYGRSIIDAIHFAIGCQYDWLLTMDCDLQHDASQLPDFHAAIALDDADVISGSRYLRESSAEGAVPQDRRRINQLVTQMINDRLGLKLTDSFCGYKALRVSAAEKLHLTETGYALPLEFWVQVARHRLRVKEIPVSRIYVDQNRSFGGKLDDSETRLTHYRCVFDRAMRQAGLS